MTRYEAFIETSWREAGVTQLVVARIRGEGRTDIGFFLVDLWCLGVKDAFLLDDRSEAEFRELVDERLPPDARERFHPACAKKLIEGAIVYAEGLGFSPHRDYRKARRVLSGVDATDCPESFTFGRNGRPCFVQGPNDTPERADRVLSILEARRGEDGYDYICADEEEDDPDDAREALKMFFEDEPDDAHTFYELSGLITAMVTCPTVLSPTKVLEVFWAPEGRVWADEDEAQDFVDDLRVYWNYLASVVALCAAGPANEPAADPVDVFLEDFDEAADMTVAIVLWARGFIRATTEWPAAWGDALTRADLAPDWRLLRAWAEPARPESIEVITAARAADAAHGTKSNDLPLAVFRLIRALRPAAPTAP